jgi:hypothetical protein
MPSDDKKLNNAIDGMRIRRDARLKKFLEGDVIRVTWKNDKKEHNHIVIKKVDNESNYVVLNWGSLDGIFGDSKSMRIIADEVLPTVMIASSKTRLYKVKTDEEKILYEL